MSVNDPKYVNVFDEKTMKYLKELTIIKQKDIQNEFLNVTASSSEVLTQVSKLKTILKQKNEMFNKHKANVLIQIKMGTYSKVHFPNKYEQDIILAGDPELSQMLSEIEHLDNQISFLVEIRGLLTNKMYTIQNYFKWTMFLEGND